MFPDTALHPQMSLTAPSQTRIVSANLLVLAVLQEITLCWQDFLPLPREKSKTGCCLQ